MRTFLVGWRLARTLRGLGRTAVPAAALALLPVAVEAQTTTGAIRGTVTTAAGTPAAGVTIAARSVETNQIRGAQVNEAGTYFIAGLRPGGYEVTARRVGLTPQTRTVQVLIGTTLDVSFRLADATVTLETVQVTAAPVVETRTSEVGVNVTREQINALPQPDRNFLNFAGLAPGVTVSRDEQNKQIRAGGLNASRINVFIDGASFKNEVLEGGVHGQDASRGNPFPQLAIREFRVLTQNFKAEYQRAASAVVTATTRSGTNELEVESFVLGQNKGLVATNPGLREECRIRDVACPTKPEYERLQAGFSVGGPIQRDRLFFFGGYEGNFQNREAIVRVGRDEFREEFGQYEGVFDQPFRSHLPFGKLTWQIDPVQTLDLSYTGRIESDKRNFGGTTSFESAENLKIGYHVLTLQHGWSLGDWFNQAHVSAQRSTWNPTAVNENAAIGRDYGGIIRIGSRDTEQEFVQDRIAFRNDLTRSNVQWFGSHVIKGGANVDLLNYKVEKRLYGEPIFRFNAEESLTIPTEANYGFGDPGMDESNVQFGLYVQDDWDVTDRLQLNLGVRWDAETNQFNNNWVTPDSIRQRFAGEVPESYFTRGSSDRPMFLGAVQPRVGFSFDVTGSGRTVLHGGYGVYYDREVWNRLLDERYRLQWRTLTFPFTTTGETNQIPWRDEYLSREGLESILTSANRPGLAEIMLLNNDTRPPRSDQFSLGVRQTAGPVVLGVAYRGVRAKNILSWYCATPHSVHGFCEGLGEQGDPTYRGLVLSTDEGRSWYDAFDLTLEKPFTAGSRWGATVSYTNAQADRKGEDFFTLAYPGVDPADWPREPQNIERHRISASGIVQLPYELLLSSLVQLGSGTPYDQIDEVAGWGPARARVFRAVEDADTFAQVDARLQKDFTLPQGRVGVSLEVINLFDRANYRSFQNLYRFEGGALNQNFGRPDFGSADQGRRLQLGLTLGRD